MTSRFSTRSCNVRFQSIAADNFWRNDNEQLWFRLSSDKLVGAVVGIAVSNKCIQRDSKSKCDRKSDTNRCSVTVISAARAIHPKDWRIVAQNDAHYNLRAVSLCQQHKALQVCEIASHRVVGVLSIPNCVAAQPHVTAALNGVTAH